MIASRRTANRGLTLMEILVVLVIVGIIAGLAVLSAASLGGDTPQEKTARRIASLLQLASQNAVMESQQYGLAIKPHSYRFYIYKNNQWKPITDKPIFRKRKVGGDTVLKLSLKGRRVALPQPVSTLASFQGAFADGSFDPPQTSQTRKTDGPQPQILALASGRLTAFNLEVASTGANASYHVKGHMGGKIQIIPPDFKTFNN